LRRRPWRRRLCYVIREPNELTIADDGSVVLPLGVLAEAGLSPGSSVLAYSNGDGRIVLRREEDAVQDLIESGRLD
jgi:bifunctional DNA-binding transcriptional regulator/antitoxin component of YhaV-PrlF toxin-antitoxin module